MSKQIYSFEFRERIPKNEIEKIIVITKSGFSHKGKISNPKNNFSLLNFLIFSSLIIYIPIISLTNNLKKNIEYFFFFSISKIINFFPIKEDSSTNTVLTFLFLASIIASIIFISIILFTFVLFYFHIKIIQKYRYQKKNVIFF